MSSESENRAVAALFATCLVDLMRPSVGFAAAALIERCGFALVVPEGQTCCGQPNYNSGDRRNARAMARHTMNVLEPFETVVVPSGSCAAMIKIHYPQLFDVAEPDHKRAVALAQRVHELVTFLADHGLAETSPGSPGPAAEGTVTYHDSCAGLRELGINEAPRSLLRDAAGVEVTELSEPEVCCGFGGAFCVKYPDISERMVENKVADILQTGAETVAMGDVGCLLNIEGRLLREGRQVRACHIAELLAGQLEET